MMVIKSICEFCGVGAGGVDLRLKKYIVLNNLFEVKEKSTPKRLHTKLYVRVVPNHTPLSPLGGDLSLKTATGKKGFGLILG